MNQFYLTLPSNSVDPNNRYTSLGIEVEGNTQAHFATKLPQRIALGPDWECALTEIIYPHSWYNISATDKVGRCILVRVADKKALAAIMVEPGYYTDASQLATIINASLVKATHAFGDQNQSIKIHYDQLTRRVSLHKAQPSSNITIAVAEKLRYMLGFKASDIENFNTASAVIVKASYPPDLRAGFDCMYIYCNIVSNQIIGDAMAPLLRVVPVEGKPDDILCRTYSNPHYVPVQKFEFDSIDIAIKDDQDKFVGFLYGKVVLKLHFRRKKFSFLS